MNSNGNDDVTVLEVCIYSLKTQNSKYKTLFFLQTKKFFHYNSSAMIWLKIVF